MDFSISKEAFVFLSAVLCGGLLHVLYDLFFIIRKKSAEEKIVIHVQDGLFWILAFFIIFFSLLTINGGIVRFYELLGVVLGVVLYHLTLSRFILKLVCKILAISSKIFNFFLKILLTPLRFLYNIIYRYICIIFLPMKKLIRRLYRRLTEAIRRTLAFSRKQ